MLGAILVVTGPTVILPMLRQARLNKESASLLKWEGIVNDPLGVLLCATDNFSYNALVCKAQGHKFGHHRTFQLTPHYESKQEQKRLALQQRGYFAFDPPTDFHTLQRRLMEGWAVQTTSLSKDFDLDRLESYLDKLSDDWLLLGSVSPQGDLQLYSNEQPFKAAAGWTLLYCSPENKNNNRADEAEVESAAAAQG